MSTEPSTTHLLATMPGVAPATAGEAAQALGRLLFNTPEYQAFLRALTEVNRDAQVQRLSARIRDHNTALQWGAGDILEHQAALKNLEAELASMPLFRGYRQAEAAVIDLFHAVDEAVGQAAGVPFAANARRSGCGCGS